MEYFILNEHSLPIDDSNHMSACLKQFFRVYKTAKKHNFEHIRVSNNIDSKWYEIVVGNGVTLRSWIQQQNYDYEISLKSLITATQCPIYTPAQIEQEHRAKLSEFTYKEQAVPNLGATHLLQQLSLSFNALPMWDSANFTAEHHELTSRGNIIKKDIVINNVTSLEHWLIHYEGIESKQKTSIIKCKERIAQLSTYFPNILFANDAEKNLRKERFTPTFFNEVWDVLMDLNQAVTTLDAPLTCELIKSVSHLDISDESDTTKQKPKLRNHRMFMYNDERHFFGYHVKNFQNGRRLHFIVDGNKIVIGYIGKHLPY